MKRHLVVLTALLLVVALAMPALAAVEFKYGGEFRTRFINNDNNLFGEVNGLDNSTSTDKNDNQLFIDQRFRMYFTFIASENLRVVSKFEIGDVTWGRSGGRLGASSGGNTGADAVNVETKNVYVEFNIPQTPVTAFVGIQGINLLSSWIIDDDFSAAVLRAKFDPVTAKLGYVAGQVDEIGVDGLGTTWQSRIDSWFLDVAYKNGPWSGGLIGYYQFGHNTLASAEPAVMWTPSTTMYNPASNPLGYPTFGAGVIPFGNNSILAVDEFSKSGSVLYNQFTPQFMGIDQTEANHVKDNNLFDLGLNLQYKIDWASAYFNFVKNLGAVDIYNADESTKIGADYTGFMLDAGASFFCGPYTFNLGGFYTTGDKLNINETGSDAAGGGYGTTSYANSSIDRFVYPRSTQKNFSEIIGGGILDNNQNIAHTDAGGNRDYQWEGYGWPSNLWTVSVGASWQALEKTKLSGSYWYFGTSEEVLGKGGYAASDIGHELDFYLTQGIVDGLNLDLVAAYLIKGDAYSASLDVKDAYELGARLIWNF